MSIKFERVAAAFDEFSRDWRPCDSSSNDSEHYRSSGTANSLSDLVNSFIESGSSDSYRHHHEDPEGIITSTIGDDDDDQEVKLRNIVNGKSEMERKRETEVFLNSLISGDHDDNVLRLKAIVAEETAAIEDRTADHEVNISLKRRRLMALLRQRGYDAGVCKSRWEKTSRHPAGKYEYIDVILPPSKSSTSSGRYIVEVFPAAHFEVAGPTDHYSALLAALPAVFVGRAEDLKQTVRLMSVAMKHSLKTSGLPVAPWRTRGYLVAKWFAPYKRTTNATPTSDDDAANARKVVSTNATTTSSDAAAANARKVVLGFDKKQQVSTYNNYCRSAQFSGKPPHAAPPLRVRIGLLTAAFQGKS